MRIWIPLALLVFTICIPSVVSAQIFFDETISGDLGDPTDGSTTILGLLGLGGNTVSGILDNDFSGPNNGLDRDSFTFTVAQGQQLDSLSFTALNGGFHFYALSNQDTAVSTNSGGDNYYASLIGDESIGVNLLDGTVNDSGGAGGTGPLAAGDYTFWFQETDFSIVNYSLALTTSTAVPEPCSTLVLLCSGGLICLRRRRRNVS